MNRRARTPNTRKKDARLLYMIGLASSRFAALVELPAYRQAGAHLLRRSGTNFFARDVGQPFAKPFDAITQFGARPVRLTCFYEQFCGVLMTEAPTLQHEFKFKLHGHTVTMKILAYRKLTEYELNSCIYDYIRSLKKKRLKKDETVIWQTIFGATQGI